MTVRDPARRKASIAAYRARHRDEVNARAAAYHAAHREDHKTRCAAYHIANRETVQERKRALVAENRESRQLYNAAYRASHAELAREHHRRGNAKRRGAPMCEHAACLILGASRLAWQINPHVCYLCGTPVWEGVNLHMDHVQPIARGGLHCADNLRPACGPCNLSKGAKAA
jgi:5-methylcytosine-specific restriction endonuclease McrA